MSKRSKPAAGKGRAATTLAACPSCFAMVAAPFLSWHLAKCPNSSHTPKSVGTDLAPVTPIKREVDETKRRFPPPQTCVPIKREPSVPETFAPVKRELGETMNCSAPKTLVPSETQKAWTNQAFASQTLVSHTQVDVLKTELMSHAQAPKELPPEKGGVSKTPDVRRVDMQDSCDPQTIVLEAQSLKASTPIPKRDSDESLCKCKELESKYNELLNIKADLQAQLARSKEAEKEARNLADSLRAALNEKGDPRRALSSCGVVEVVDLEGGSGHSGGVDTENRVIHSLKKKRDQDGCFVSPNLAKPLTNITSRKIDRSPDFVSEPNRSPEEALTPKLNAGKAAEEVDINIDAVRIRDVSNVGSESHWKIQVDQGSHSVPIPSSCAAPVISCPLAKVSEKLEFQDIVPGGRISGLRASINPCLPTEVLGSGSQSPLISGEQLECLNSSGKKVPDKLRDLARQFPVLRSPEKSQVFSDTKEPEFEQLFPDGYASQSSRRLESITVATNEMVEVAIPNVTESTRERRIASDLCQLVCLEKAKDEVSRESIFHLESQQLIHPKNKFLNRCTDLSTTEHCGLPSSPTDIDNQVSLSSASEDIGFVIKKAKSRLRPDVIMSDSESEGGCNKAKKSMCGLASQGVEPVHAGIAENKNIEGKGSYQVELSHIAGRLPIGDHIQEHSSVERVGKVTNRRRAKLVKGYRRIQQDQAGEPLADANCGVDAGQIKQFNSEAEAKKSESPLENALGAATEKRGARKRETTGVRTSKRLKLKSLQNAKTDLQSSRATSSNVESMSDEAKNTSSGETSSDCESISEIRGKRPSRPRRKLCNGTPQTQRNAKRKSRLKREIKHSAGSRRHGGFIVDMEGSEGSEDSQSFDGNESCEGSSLDGFLVDNEESESTPEGNEKESSGGTEASGSEDSLPLLPSSSLDYRKIIDEKRKNYAWDFEGDMLSAFAKDSNLCLRAVCALYRQQTEDEQMEGGSKYTNKRGFDRTLAARGSSIAEFLTEGEPFGPMKKVVDDLNNYDSTAADFCLKLAFKHSKQLFEIYKYDEDSHFPYA